MTAPEPCAFTSWAECADHPDGDPELCNVAADKLRRAVAAAEALAEEWSTLADRFPGAKLHRAHANRLRKALRGEDDQ